MTNNNKLNFKYYLMLVTDIFKDFPNLNEAELFISMSIKYGVNMVQLRDDSKLDNEKFFFINKIKNKFPNALIIINTHYKLAQQSNADGIHIKESKWNKTIKNMSTDMIIGKSVHLDESTLKPKNLSDSNELPIPNYIIFGTIFSSSTHPEIKPIGINYFRKIKKIYNNSIILAIGGINEKNTKQIIKAGADGVAIKSAIINSINPENIIRLTKNALLKNDYN